MKKKNLFIIAAVVIAIVLAAILIIVMINKKDAYRLISVENSEGAVDVTRDSSPIEVFAGMNLISEDDLETASEATATLLVDTDKHIVVNPDSFLHIIAVGSEKKGKIGIDLERGVVHFAIDNPLPKNSEFEVTTPNALLSVRGTIFDVTYFTDYNATLVQVIEGIVSAKADGSDEETLVEAGESILIVEDDEGELQTIYPYEDADSGIRGIAGLFRSEPNVWLERADGSRILEFYNEDMTNYDDVFPTATYHYIHTIDETPRDHFFEYNDFASNDMSLNEKMKSVYETGEWEGTHPNGLGGETRAYYKYIDSVDTEFGTVKIILQLVGDNTPDHKYTGKYAGVLKFDDETYVYVSFEGAYTIGPRHEDGSRISDEEYDYSKYREYADMVDRDHEYLEVAKEEFIELCRYH